MKRALLVLGGLVAAAALIVGLVVFQPWLLFSDVRVDEALPTIRSTQPAATADPDSSATPMPDSVPDQVPEPVPVVLASGSFVSQEHATTGTATIIGNPDGTRVLAIENLDTTNGPDVHVWLSAADAVEGLDGWFLAGGTAYVDLGVIKGNQGNQVYDIPAEVDLTAYRSVSLWCVQFSVGFGAAQLG
ncbi:DM13 domain-containing protein [Herbiconiux sp. CPCC 205763]|uniref:DM13 domain-containing protein n=1 Tax=Herbiconiux aconitum TaxID=2970913 RepID=A0ABT2GPH5_9MICO|nr:DM13 domain-containing protein [Herbiconiux aconitum]MCS5718124.1 DM13 domain-containing protein [Herbiconiux aconitum]